jgi:dUTP pyrophosphatase
MEKFRVGWAVAIPAGYEGECRPRSGLACNHGITIINSPGTIDSDYRGEILVTLINHSKDIYTVKHGDRVFQMLLHKVEDLPLVEVDSLDETERGQGGHGSTGR